MTEDGSIASPYTDLSLLFESGRVQPGQTIYFREGVYTQAFPPLHISGIAQAPIVLRPYQNETVILRPSSGARVFDVEGCAHLILQDFVIDALNCDLNGVKVTGGAQHILFRNVDILNAADQGFLVTGADTHDITLEHSQVHHCGTDPQLQHGIYIGAGANIRITGCHIHHCSGHAVHVYGGAMGYTWQVDGNYIHDCFHGIGAYYGIGQVINNVIRATGVGIGLRYDLKRALVAFNTVMGSVGQNLIAGYFNHPTMIDIRNNVLAQGRWNLSIDNPSEIPANQQISATHNLLSDAGETALQQNGSQAGVILSNVEASFTPVTDDGENGIMPDEGNPAIGAGVAIAEVTTDYGGNMRSDPPTIGAWE